ncbi:hypothetical protein CFP56_010703 [Quercus suber]|uniref:RNase H type-1 domain-containing protein n=1 Tax=Quercus suber TaxID=58331 RepID=A0AAW0KZ15_QUESU
MEASVTWHPSPTNIYKINYNGGIFAKENKLGIGVVVRDSNGLVIASMVQQFPQAYKAVEIEAMAASRASEFGLEIGIHQAILEDSTWRRGPTNIRLSRHMDFRLGEDKRAFLLPCTDANNGCLQVN